MDVRGTPEGTSGGGARRPPNISRSSSKPASGLKIPRCKSWHKAIVWLHPMGITCSIGYTQSSAVHAASSTPASPARSAGAWK